MPESSQFPGSYSNRNWSLLLNAKNGAPLLGPTTLGTQPEDSGCQIRPKSRLDLAHKKLIYACRKRTPLVLDVPVKSNSMYDVDLAPKISGPKNSV